MPHPQPQAKARVCNPMSPKVQEDPEEIELPARAMKSTISPSRAIGFARAG